MFHPQRSCGWQNGNDFGMMFVMAVRAGYRPDRAVKVIAEHSVRLALMLEADPLRIGE
jgi:hypothetical protein